MDAPESAWRALPEVPRVLPPLIGRERQLDTLAQLLASSAILTLTGPAGVGKTRLAQALVCQQAHEAVVWFDAGRRGPGQHARPRASVLTVIDGGAHPPQALAAWAGAARAEHLLITSRQRLGIRGETVWSTPPLAVSDSAQAPAVRLFALCAAAAQPGFALAPELVPRVVRLARALGGMPLAIELAAQRMRHMTFAELERACGG